MGRSLKFALIAALPIEVVNLIFFGIHVNLGVPTHSHWYTELLGSLWFYMHLPSMVAIDRFGFLQSQPDFGSFIMFLSGYIGTALLLFAALLCLQGLFYVARIYIAPRT